MQFSVGSKVVLPAQGLGLVQGIESVELEGPRATFYVLKMLDSGSVIRVNVARVDAVGLRPVMTPEDADEVFEVLRDRSTPPDTQTWNRRYREYTGKIGTGNPMEVAKVLRDLALMKMEKNLSFGEKKMYDQARTLLVQEIAVARDMEEAGVEADIDALFVPGAVPAVPLPSRRKKRRADPL